MIYHFEYTSGGNPYIAKTENERDRIIKKHETAGDKVTEIRTGFYIIDDKHDTQIFQMCIGTNKGKNTKRNTRKGQANEKIIRKT